MTTPADIIAEAIHCGLSSYMPNHHLNAESIIAALDAAGYTIVPKADTTDWDWSYVLDGHTFTRLPDGSVYCDGKPLFPPVAHQPDTDDTCPTCGSDDPSICLGLGGVPPHPWSVGHCTSGWHDRGQR